MFNNFSHKIVKWNTTVECAVVLSNIVAATPVTNNNNLIMYTKTVVYYNTI